jgi:hypothetical protein
MQPPMYQGMRVSLSMIHVSPPTDLALEKKRCCAILPTDSQPWYARKIVCFMHRSVPPMLTTCSWCCCAFTANVNTEGAAKKIAVLGRF